MKSLIGVKDILQKLYILCKKSYLNAFQTLKISTHSIESKVNLTKKYGKKILNLIYKKKRHSLINFLDIYIYCKDHLIKIDNLLLQTQLNNISYFSVF
jgi:hypothetical protein